MAQLTRRSFVSLSGTALVTALLAGCSSGGGSGDAGSASSGGGKAIYVLTPSEDHGWTGSVATFAKAKIKEVNDEGTYKAELQTADTAEKQISEVEDILAGDTSQIAGIVIQPMDDTLQSAIQSIVDHHPARPGLHRVPARQAGVRRRQGARRRQVDPGPD